MLAKISVGIPFYKAGTILIGGLKIKFIAHRIGKGSWIFLPFGFWDWTTAGYLPPVSEYWRKRQEGGWKWQIDNPSVIHILLFQGDNPVGAVIDFKRNDLEKGKEMSGNWILKDGTDETSGNYESPSISFDYY